MRPNSKDYKSFSIGGKSEVSKKETGGKKTNQEIQFIVILKNELD